MTRYVMVDGCLQRSSPEIQRWHQRALKAQPTPVETEAEPVVELRDRRADWEILENLKESDNDL